MRWIHYFLCLLVIFLFCGCDIQSFELRLEVQGTVRDAANGNGVSGATVILSSVRFAEEEILASDTTDDLGHYEIIQEFGDEHECVMEQIVLTVEKSAYNKQFITYNEITSRYIQCCAGVQVFDFDLVRF